MNIRVEMHQNWRIIDQWIQYLVTQKIKKSDKPIAKLTLKRKKIQITKIRNANGNLINFTEIKSIIMECYQQLYTNKLDEMYILI